MEGDDEHFSKLRRDLQEAKSAILELSSRLTMLEVLETRLKHLEHRQQEISKMFEEHYQRKL
jgi:hypothetical protein